MSEIEQPGPVIEDAKKTTSQPPPASNGLNNRPTEIAPLTAISNTTIKPFNNLEINNDKGIPSPQMPTPNGPGEEESNVRADYTMIGERNAKRDSRYGPPTAEAPYGYVNGRPRLGRNSPSINGSVDYLGKHTLGVVIDDTEDRVLDDVYSQLQTRLDRNEKRRFRPQKGIAEIVYEVSKKTLPYRKKKEERFDAAQRAKGIESVSLGEYVKIKAGVCRQQALLAAYLLERLRNEGRIEGSIHLNRAHKARRVGRRRVGHEWVRWKKPNGEVLFIDPAQDFVGTREEAKKRPWGFWKDYDIDMDDGKPAMPAPLRGRSLLKPVREPDSFQEQPNKIDKAYIYNILNNFYNDPDFKPVAVREHDQSPNIETRLTRVFQGFESVKKGKSVDLSVLLSATNDPSDSHGLGTIYIETESGAVILLEAGNHDAQSPSWWLVDHTITDDRINLLGTASLTIGEQFDAELRTPEGQDHYSTPSPVKRIVVVQSGGKGLAAGEESDIVDQFDRTQEL